MKVLIVFSSRLETDANFWRSLIVFNRPENVNGDGRLYVFNGKNYCYNNDWVFSELGDKIKEVIDTENGGNEYAVLFHTQCDDELQKLITVCSGINISIFRKFSTGLGLFNTHIQPLRANLQGGFSVLWEKLQENEITEKNPEEGTKAHARILAKYICNHNCNNVISYLKTPIEKLEGGFAPESENAKKTILDFGKDLVEKYYYNSMSLFEKIVKMFPNNPEICKIPGKLVEAKEKYTVIYREVESTDNNSNEVIVNNGQTIIRLHQETIDILEKEVLQNGEEDL